MRRLVPCLHVFTVRLQDVGRLDKTDDDEVLDAHRHKTCDAVS